MWISAEKLVLYWSQLSMMNHLQIFPFFAMTEGFLYWRLIFLRAKFKSEHKNFAETALTLIFAKLLPHLSLSHPPFTNCPHSSPTLSGMLRTSLLLLPISLPLLRLLSFANSPLLISDALSYLFSISLHLSRFLFFFSFFGPTSTSF